MCSSTKLLPRSFMTWLSQILSNRVLAMGAPPRARISAPRKPRRQHPGGARRRLRNYTGRQGGDMGADKIAMTLAVCLAAATAYADTKTLAEAGTWEAFGGTTTQGRPVCGVSQEVGGRYFGLKLYSGGETFTIQLGTKEWKLDDKAKIKVVLRFDAHNPWNATGTAFH